LNILIGFFGNLCYFDVWAKRIVVDTSKSLMKRCIRKAIEKGLTFRQALKWEFCFVVIQPQEPERPLRE
jgi:hypothetical protein